MLVERSDATTPVLDSRWGSQRRIAPSTNVCSLFGRSLIGTSSYEPSISNLASAWSARSTAVEMARGP